MISLIANGWKNPIIRKKLLYTLFLIVLFRIGSNIPLPFVDTLLLANQSEVFSQTIFSIMDTFSGGAFSMATIFALSIQPYINASIIMQLLVYAVPALESLQKEGGEAGKKKIKTITYIVTLALGIVQAIGYYVLIKRYGITTGFGNEIWGAVIISVILVAGSMLLTFLGEKSEKIGIGSGISTILLAGIISRAPTALASVINAVILWFQQGPMPSVSGTVDSGTLQMYAQLFGGLRISPWVAAGALVMITALTVFVVFMNDAERRIPVQYSQKQVGRRTYSRQATYLPLKLSMAGVLPIIFAQSIISLPNTVFAFTGTPETGFWKSVYDTIQSQSAIYIIIYFILIFAFSFFYNFIQFNPVEMANDLQKNGGFIPGFRPGRPTSELLGKIATKVTIFGAIYISAVAIVPILISKIPDMGYVSLSGTSVIVVVGIALETAKQLESELSFYAYNYTGFLS